jgi:hypothetical protein
MAIFVRQQNDIEKISPVFLVRITPYFCSAVGNVVLCLARLPIPDFRSIHDLIFTSHHHYLFLAHRLFLPVANLWKNR